MVRALGAAAFCALVVGGCGKTEAQREPLPEAVVFGGGRRVLLNDGSPRSWLPSQAEADKAEAGLEAHLRAHEPKIAEKLPTYYGQLWGEREQGQKVIRMNFFCNSYVDHVLPIMAGAVHDAGVLDSWKRSPPVLMNDGGPCYFQVDFNPKTNTYGQVHVNGDA